MYVIITDKFRFNDFVICQGTSTRRYRRDLFSIRVKLPPVTTTKPLKDWGNLVKCLIQGHNKQTCWLSFHYHFFMLNVKQESC